VEEVGEDTFVIKDTKTGVGVVTNRPVEVEASFLPKPLRVGCIVFYFVAGEDMGKIEFEMASLKTGMVRKEVRVHRHKGGYMFYFTVGETYEVAIPVSDDVWEAIVGAARKNEVTIFVPSVYPGPYRMALAVAVDVMVNAIANGLIPDLVFTLEPEGVVKAAEEAKRKKKA